MSITSLSFSKVSYLEEILKCHFSQGRNAASPDGIAMPGNQWKLGYCRRIHSIPLLQSGAGCGCEKRLQSVPDTEHLCKRLAILIFFKPPLHAPVHGNT